MHLQGSGATGFSCSRHSFSKSGQAITTDLSDCLPHKVEVTGVEYCSDSDEIQVSVNDKNIPWGMGKLTVTAENVACSALQSDAVALSGCSGSGVPDVSAPRCYKGAKSVLGLGETIEITLEDFDTSSNSGHMHLQGNGATGFSCSRHSFSKSGQAITTDLSNCLPHKVEVTGVEY